MSYYIKRVIVQNQGMKKKVAALQQIVESCPGLIIALILLAQSQAASGNYTSAVELLKNLLHNIDPSNIDAYLALAQIHIAQVNVITVYFYLFVINKFYLIVVYYAMQSNM